MNSVLEQAKERTKLRKDLHLKTLHSRVACRNEAIAVFLELAKIAKDIAPEIDVKQCGSLNKRSYEKLKSAVEAIELPKLCSIDAYAREGKLHIYVTHHYEMERLEIRNFTVESVTRTIKFSDYVWDFYEEKMCDLIETEVYTVEDVLEAEASINPIEQQIRELQDKLHKAKNMVNG